MTKKSEFGKGLTYCLALFLCHSERSYEVDKIVNRPDMWFNASSDHLYDLEIPAKLPKELKKRLKEFRDKCLKWGHGYPKVDSTKEDQSWSVNEAKELIRLIDEFYGVKTIKGDWQ